MWVLPCFFSSSSCWLSEEGDSVMEEVLMSCGQRVKGDSHTEGQGTEGPVWDFVKGVSENGFPFFHLPRESMLILAVLCVFHFCLLHPRNFKTPWNWFWVECCTMLGFPISHLIQSSLGLSLTPPSGPSPGGQPKHSNLQSISGEGSQCWRMTRVERELAGWNLSFFTNCISTIVLPPLKQGKEDFSPLDW